MRRRNKLIYFSNTIYALSKDYGFTCVLYRPTETTDIRTGRKIVTRERFPIKKAVFLPSQLYRDYNYARILANNLQFGGLLDVSQRAVLINKKYLPKNFKILVTDYIVMDHIRYEMVKIDEMEFADYWYLITKQVTGVPVSEVFVKSVKDSIIIEEELESA